MLQPRTKEQRKVFSREMTPELALKIGKLLGNKFRTTCVSTDGHPSSPMIYNAFKAGVMAAGGDVVNCGQLPSAAMPFADKVGECYVTIGSRGPDSISGLEIHNRQGAYFDEAQLFSVTSMEERMLFPTYDRLGHEIFDDTVLDRYLKGITEGIDSADCVVALDRTYPLSTDAAVKMLTSLGAETVTVCKSMKDGNINLLRDTDLRTLGRTVRSMEDTCSMGAAFNRDATRLAMFDDKGRFISGDTMAMILVKALKPEKICVPVDMTMGIDDVSDGIVLRSQSDIMSVVDMSKDKDFACDREGRFLFPKQTCTPDAINALLKFACISSETKLSTIIDGFNEYYRKEQTLRTSASRAKLDKFLKEKISTLEYTSLTDIDGFRVEFDSGWFLLRHAANDDSLTITCEARDKAYLVGLMEIAKNIAVECIKMAD